MSIPRALPLLLALVFSVASCKGNSSNTSAPGASSASTVEAQRAAEAWLALCDGGQFAQSWTDAASYFKTKVDSPTWEKMVSSVRAPLGALKSRELATATPATSLPGAPDGEYVVLTFETSFEHKAAAVETVTPMKDKDGKWRVSGYFIK